MASRALTLKYRPQVFADLVGQDPTLPARAVAHLLAPVADTGDEHPDLLEHLRSTYRRADLTVLHGEPPLVAAVLVLASVTPRPRVAHVVARTMKQLMALLVPGDAGWEKASRTLTGAFIESLADLPSESAPNRAGPRTGEAERAGEKRKSPR